MFNIIISALAQLVLGLCLTVLAAFFVILLAALFVGSTKAIKPHLLDTPEEREKNKSKMFDPNRTDYLTRDDDEIVTRLREDNYSYDYVRDVQHILNDNRLFNTIEVCRDDFR